MGLGVFVAVAGLLLPLVLFIRILAEVYRLRHNVGAPSAMWRILLLTFLLIPITAGLPSIESVFSSTPNHATKAFVEYMATDWGIYILLAKVMAVLAHDYISPIIIQELGEIQIPPSKKLSLAWFTRDLGLVIFCMVSALIVWFIKFPPW